MGSLYRRKGKYGKRIWWCKYYVRGRPVRESTRNLPFVCWEQDFGWP